MSLNPEYRRSIENGIWLCQNCAKLVDSDTSTYQVTTLNNWKKLAENFALTSLESAQVNSGPPIEELVTLVEIRATAIVGMMRQEKEQLHTNRFRCRLDVMTNQFLLLHAQHTQQLRLGNLIAAHELVGEIHRLLQRYDSEVTPKDTTGLGGSRYRYYCLVTLHGEEVFEEFLRYPGIVPQPLFRRLSTEMQSQLISEERYELYWCEIKEWLNRLKTQPVDAHALGPRLDSRKKASDEQASRDIDNNE